MHSTRLQKTQRKEKDIEALNKISEKIIGSAIEVHKRLGPGFTERIYQEALSSEFNRNGIRFDREKPFSIEYKGELIGEQRFDFIVEDSIVVETKSAERIIPVHVAQVLSYLKASGKKLGLILNFADLRLGIKRVIN